MKKFTAIFIILVIVLTGILFRNSLLEIWTKWSLKLPEFEKDITLRIADEVSKQISAPPPIQSQSESQNASLTRSGVIKWTNDQRAQNNLPSLRESAILDTMANMKLNDMFDKQYFAHISPSGIGVGDLAKSSGYDFLIIGENLALGNFENDKALVQAWMNSEGHRANILNNKFAEIGVAVGKGNYDGKTTWIAVQHFGLPLSTCTEPNKQLKAGIEANQAKINQMQAELDLLKTDIETMRPRRDMDLYNSRIEEYNNLISQYNLLVRETKDLISDYNKEVSDFNACATGIR